MRFNPSLRLLRLVVLKDGKRAYDERFHAGVNIIRGVPGDGNSVGKSTIADLIFFALGGDLTKFKDEARLCEFVIAEVMINGSVATLRREIAEASMQPMSVFFGDFEASQISGSDGWQRFPYKRYGDRESFTQVLFRMMAMPEVPAEAEANITMHQLLRLMYVDQMTPVDRIFRFEAKDSALRRQAVGDLLCGVFDERIYPAQLVLREKEQAHEQASQQYGALHRILSASGDGFNLDFVTSRRSNVQQELNATILQIENLRSRRFDQEPGTEATQSIVSTLKADLDKINVDIINDQAREGELTYGIEDASLLIEDIERTLKRLKEGEIARSSIGPLSFTFCPSCFAALKETGDEHSCKLCHSPLEPDGDRSRTARMRNELELQLKESRQLQETRKSDLTAIRRKLEKRTAIRDTLAAEYIRISRDFLTENDALINRLTGRIGYLERELVEIERERGLAEQLYQLSEQRSRLNEEISTLRSNILAWKQQKDRKQAGAYGAITKHTAVLLTSDLHTEAEFTSASDVYFDFAEDRITVNGKSGFSASSLTILRNAFHLALHWSSCTNNSFRYPRFLLMDNIEDKGMTEARSQNFQRLIVATANAIDVEHQIIFTTSMIDPSLDRPDLTVGDKYDFNNKSLKIGRSKNDLATV